MLIINAQQVYELLSMSACIDLMARTQADLSVGKISIPLRQSVSTGDNSLLLLMPGSNPDLRVSGAKILTVHPDNPNNRAEPKPAIQGYIIIFDTNNGTPLALIDAASVTAIRTAAASAMATRILANPQAAELTILGCGVQASSHIDAICTVRNIDTIRVWSRDPQKVEAFVRALQHKGHKATRVIAETDAAAATASADIICAVTGSHTPVIHAAALRDGCHINLVGAHSPDSREADARTLQRARVFTEINEFAHAESGDIRMAIAEGYLDPEDIAGEIGAVILKQIQGRENPQQITLYKSLGNVAQDLAAARYLYDQMT